MNYKLIDRILTLGNLISQAKLAYIEADTNLQVSSWNQGARDLFAYTEDDTIGRFLNELIPIGRHKLINCKQTQFLTCAQVNHKGQEVQYDFFYAPIMNTKGEKLGVAVLAKDISDKFKSRVNLKPQSEYLQDIFGSAPIGIWHVNMEGNIIFANSEYAWMLGYESAKAVAEQISDFAVQTFFDKKKPMNLCFLFMRPKK